MCTDPILGVKVRHVVGAVLSAAAAESLVWAVISLVQVGACGDINTPACPASIVPTAAALIGGIIGLVIGTALTVGLGVLIAGVVGGVTALVRALLGSGHSTSMFIVAAAFLAFPVVALVVVLVVGGSAAAKQVKIAEFKQRAAKASGVITAVADTGVTINDNPRVRLTVRYHLANGAVAKTQTKLVVSRLKIPRRGDAVTVWHHPSRKERWSRWSRRHRSIRPARTSTRARPRRLPSMVRDEGWSWNSNASPSCTATVS